MKIVGARYLVAAVISAFICVLLIGPTMAFADETIKLSEPKFKSGATILTALKNRKSDRSFDSARALTQQQLSELLWAAGGVNRPAVDGEKPGRTFPSGHNSQCIDIYAFMSDGIYRYEPEAHELKLIQKGDHRAATGVQNYVADAPLNLLYVAHMSQAPGSTEMDKRVNVSYDVGHMSQSVYLYCASSGLNVIVRSSIDQEALRKLLGLNNTYEPLLGQTIGFQSK
ncbi:nitroreductase [Deltaproteobacteria bacterium Smac51]|nr:nitroreductase [Deltaproteobacteria bacterium Smac51]